MSEIFANTLFENNPMSEPLKDIVQSIMSFDETALTPTLSETIASTIKAIITPEQMTASINALKQEFDNRQITRAAADGYYDNLQASITNLIDYLKPSAQKLMLLNAVFDPILSMYQQVLESYHKYNIVLPMTLEEGAKEPTYAHETDACADLYAADTIVVPAHSTCNMIRTGVHIQLPEGWMAMIFPRSSIGAKTGLRLSNSVGIIDTMYRGQLGVLYDNISDSDYTINAGDRIAQLMVMPSYRFKAEIVDQLNETDRGEGGFGSSGK